FPGRRPSLAHAIRQALERNATRTSSNPLRSLRLRQEHGREPDRDGGQFARSPEWDDFSDHGYLSTKKCPKGRDYRGARNLAPPGPHTASDAARANKNSPSIRVDPIRR